MSTVTAPMTLDDGLARLELALPVVARQKLLAYIALVQKWNQVYNLTALRDLQQMLTHHVFDSLAVVPHLSNADTVLDVGSGAGLPGIPLALALPQVKVTLLDSNHKKAAFLRQVVIELALQNVAVMCARIEEIASTPLFGAVISRAFTDLRRFVALCGRLVAPGGRLIAMKGMLPTQEMAQLDGRFDVTRVLALAVPGVDAERHLVELRAKS